jgi:hypothetical protein
VLRVVGILAVTVVCGLPALVDRAKAQEPDMHSQASSPQLSVQMIRDRKSKTELARRFQEIKNQFSEIRAATANYTPLKSNASTELKTARLKLSAAMRSYEYYESQTQKQRDQLNLLTPLTDAESLRLQMAMDRLAKMGTTITGLVNRLNAAGDALVQSTKSAATR